MTDARWALPEESPATEPAAGTASMTGPSPDLASPDSAAGSDPMPRSVPHLPVFERELTVADVLDGGFQVIKARPRVILGIAAMVVLPIGLLVAIADFGALGGDVIATLTDPDTFEQSSSSEDGDFGFTVVATLISSAMVTAMAAPIARVVEAWYLGAEMSAWRAVASLGWSWITLVIAFVVAHVIEAIGTLLLVLPGLAAMAMLVPLAPIVALERSGPFKSIGRSFGLAQRRFWYVLWIALLTGLVATTLNLMLPLLPVAVVSIAGVGGEQYVAGAATIAASLLVLPFVAAAAVMTYLDLRVRTEGLDILHGIDTTFGSTS